MNLDATFRPIVAIAFFTIIGIALPFRIRSQSTGEKLDRTQEGMFTMIALRLGGLLLWGSVIAFGNCGCCGRREATTEPM